MKVYRNVYKSVSECMKVYEVYEVYRNVYERVWMCMKGYESVS